MEIFEIFVSARLIMIPDSLIHLFLEPSVERDRREGPLGNQELIFHHDQLQILIYFLHIGSSHLFLIMISG